jgi:prophage regulatory protein
MDDVVANPWEDPGARRAPPRVVQVGFRPGTSDAPAEVLLRKPEVLRRVGLSAAQIYRLISRGEFPAPVKLGQNSVAWIQSEVSDWVARRIAERDAGQRGAA